MYVTNSEDILLISVYIYLTTICSEKSNRLQNYEKTIKWQ